jgi:hypothetical protein
LLVAMMLDAFKTQYLRTLAARSLFARSTIGMANLNNLK